MKLFPALLALTFGLLLALPATAQPVSDAQAVVREVEAYLQNLRTMKARFVQTDATGKQVAGDFLLKRPGRMRFDYDAPVTDFIVADGRFIYYYDGQLKEQSNALISQSLADFFLREKLTLGGDIKVTDVTKEGDLLTVTLVQAKDPNAGSLMLGFTQKPMALKKWRVVDAQGAITEVELFDAVSGIAMKDAPFHYYDPGRKVPDYN